MRKISLLYSFILLVFIVGTFFTLQFGTRLYSDPNALVEKSGHAVSARAQEEPATPGAASGGGGILQEKLRNPLSILLIQVIVILLAAKVVGGALRRMGQPTVIGEMISGILLGPSLLGLLSPDLMRLIFPPSGIEPLKMLSQVGIILFMFVVGSELDVRELRRKLDTVVLVSHVSIAVPFFLGVALALLIFGSFAPPRISFNAFALFIGLSMSVTAFPVLARIIEEHGLTKSHLGRVAIACAAIDDATAWCLLAVVIALAQATGLLGAALTVLLVLLYIAAMFYLIRPQAERLVLKRLSQTQNGMLFGSLLVFLFISALVTEVIGIHALFGAFLAGVILPKSPVLQEFFTEKLKVFTGSFLLPLFFAFTGLRTQVNLLNDWSSWLICAGVIAVAVFGKLVGSMLAAYWSGMSRRDSLSLGILMNTRGLMELVVLNIGYDLGILSPQIFSMLVLMALVTTFMAGPLLSMLKSQKERTAQFVDEAGLVVR